MPRVVVPGHETRVDLRRIGSSSSRRTRARRGPGVPSRGDPQELGLRRRARRGRRVRRAARGVDRGRVDPPPGPAWVQSLLYAVTAVLLVGRRWRPLAVLAAMVAVSVVEFAAVGSPEGFAREPCADHRHVHGRERAAVAPVLAGAWSLSAVLHAAWAGFDPMNDDLVDVVEARWSGSRRRSSPGCSARSSRVSRLNVEQRRVNARAAGVQAVAEERNRIARELHDVIGHSVSVMTVQASAVRRRLEPSQVVEREASRPSRRSGERLSPRCGAWSGCCASPESTATISSRRPGWPRSIGWPSSSARAGLPVSLSVTGAARDLAPGLDLTAYRLVQEGLTNALRHARDPRRCPGLDRLRDRADRARRARRRRGGHGSAVGGAPADGNGLLGMRERVAVYGGSLVARPRPQGGFELVATLPVEPA